MKARTFEPSLSLPTTLFYIVGCLALIIATMLLAFWGGRFAQSWRMIAAAVFSYTLQICGYNTPKHIEKIPKWSTARGILGLQWVLFAIRAAVEYEISTVLAAKKVCEAGLGKMV